MSHFKMILWLAFTAAIYGQTSNPLPSVPNTQVQTCGPVADLAAMGYGFAALLRTCQSGETVAADMVGSGFQPGFVDDMTRTADGTLMLLLDSGMIVRNRDRTTQWYPTPRATAFLRSSHDEVVTLREQGEPWQYTLNWDASFYAKPLWNERVFPSFCTQVIESKVGDLYCVDRNNSKISVSTASLMRPARADEAQAYFKMPGLVFAREYKGGLLALVTAQYECGDAVPIPGGATLCYFGGTCKQKSRSQLVYLAGRNQPAASVVVYDLAIEYSSSFTVVGDTVLVVESRYDKDENWQGDYVTRVNLATGKKTPYLSIEDLGREFGFGPMELWIN